MGGGEELRVQYFTACTLDGFIADESNSLDWLFEASHSPGDTFWDDWFPTVGGMVWGATTYEGHLERNGLGTDSWREYFGDRPCWIFSHRGLPLVPDIDLRLVQGDVRPRPRRGGGGARRHESLAGRRRRPRRAVLRRGLLDQIIVGLAPATLGKGAPLLPRRITSKSLAFREAELIGQRLRITLDVGGGDS